MKSYFLAPILSRNAAETAMNQVLPQQAGQWLLKDGSGDLLAYFYLVESDVETGERTIQADILHRHYHRDPEIISVMQQLKLQVGGEITYDP
jgi:hypothetical protein